MLMCTHILYYHKHIKKFSHTVEWYYYCSELYVRDEPDKKIFLDNLAKHVNEKLIAELQDNYIKDDYLFETERIQSIADEWDFQTAINNLKGKQFKTYLEECGLNEFSVKQ